MGGMERCRPRRSWWKYTMHRHRVRGQTEEEEEEEARLAPRWQLSPIPPRPRTTYSLGAGKEERAMGVWDSMHAPSQRRRPAR